MKFIHKQKYIFLIAFEFVLNLLVDVLSRNNLLANYWIQIISAIVFSIPLILILWYLRKEALKPLWNTIVNFLFYLYVMALPLATVCDVCSHYGLL